MEKSGAVNILLVDDREDSLMALNAVLRSPEYNLVEATSGVQALELLGDRDFAVILLDVQMPGMDGLETARRIRRLERSKTTPIILVTGIFPDENHIRLGYEVGAVDFVSKPFDPRVMKSKVAVFVDLFRKTEKIRLQEKLLSEASESRFRTLFEQSPLAIQLFSLAGEGVQANRAWEKLWGNSEVRDITEGAVVKALAGESSELPPTQYLGKWVESYVYPVLNDQGDIREVAVILKDVSDRRAVEEALRQSRDQLQIIFERVGDGILVQDPDGNCVYANDGGAQLCGFRTAAEVVGANVISVLSENDVFGHDGNPIAPERWPTRLALQGALKGASSLIMLRNRKTWKERWLVVSSRPIMNEHGKPYLAVSVYRDITEQRRTEKNERFLADITAALAASLDYSTLLKRVTQLAVHGLADWCCISVADAQGNLQPAAVARADPSLEVFESELLASHPFGSDASAGAFAVFRTGHSEMHNDLSDLEPLCRVRLRAIIHVPIHARDKVIGVLALASTREGHRYDTIDLALAEELGRRTGMALDNARLYLEAQAHHDRLHQAVQARDEFISIASHEIKTPVTSLILHAEMAALQLERSDTLAGLKERMRKFVSISASQIDRLSRLIDEMLDVSRISNGKLTMEMEALDLSGLVRGVVEDFSEQFKENGSAIEFDGPPDLFVHCDRYRIQQVVTNLLTNALKYGEGKPVQVSVHPQVGGYIDLTVRDQGIGIGREDQSRIFERFERAVSATSMSGLGLGLYIVKKIVEAHQGRVSVESELRAGATFTVRFPAIQ